MSRLDVVSEKFERLAKIANDPAQILAHQAGLCVARNDIIALAGVLKAYKRVLGALPSALPETPIWGKAQALAVHVSDTLDIPCDMGIKGTDWDIVPPSDEARRQAHEARLQSGVYHGQRFVRPVTDDRRKVGNFDQRWPCHW